MSKIKDLERSRVRFPRSLLPDELLSHYIPYLKINMGFPVRRITYSFKTKGEIKDNGKRQQKVSDLAVTVNSSSRNVRFEFEEGGYIGEDSETGEDIWGIAGYHAMTTPGYDIDEFSEEEGKIIDMFKEVSLEFFKE